MDQTKVLCRCPSCGHHGMWLGVCTEPPNVGLMGFSCRGCGAEWSAEDIEEITDGYRRALTTAQEVLSQAITRRADYTRRRHARMDRELDELSSTGLGGSV